MNFFVGSIGCLNMYSDPLQKLSLLWGSQNRVHPPVTKVVTRVTPYTGLTSQHPLDFNTSILASRHSSFCRSNSLNERGNVVSSYRCLSLSLFCSKAYALFLYYLLKPMHSPHLLGLSLSVSFDSTIFITTSIYFVLYLYDLALTQNTVPMIHSIHFSYPPIICTLISLLVCVNAGSHFTLS